MTMSDEMKSKMEEMARKHDDPWDKGNYIGAWKDGFQVCHDLMAEELEKVKAERDDHEESIKYWKGKCIALGQELTAWKEHANKLRGTVATWINCRDNALTCDLKMLDKALTAFNEFKKEREG